MFIVLLLLVNVEDQAPILEKVEPRLEEPKSVPLRVGDFERITDGVGDSKDGKYIFNQ